MNQEQKTRFDRLVSFLGSMRLSFVLIVILGLLVAQRAVIAQKFVYLEEVPWFLRILGSLGIQSAEDLWIPFLAVLAVFVLNLGFSSIRMARRIRARKEGIRGYRTYEALQAFINNAEFFCPEDSEPLIRRFFKRKGFYIQSDNLGNETRIHAVKHRAGYWGVFSFHLTFLIILMGVLLSVFTRYAGYFEISPGENFIERYENYREVTEKPALFSGNSGLKIRLEEIDLSYWRQGEVKQRASIVSVFDAEGRFMGKRRIEVNNPVKIEGMNIYQGSRNGYITVLDITDSASTTAEGTARFQLPKKPGEQMKSAITLPGIGISLLLELFTEKLGEIEGLEQLGAMHMATLLKVTSKEDLRSNFRGVAFKGGSLSFEGITLRFLSLRPYTSFVVIRDYGVPVIFSGFVVMLIGLIITFFWVPENYWAIIRKSESGEVVIMGASSDKFRESFRERFHAEIEELKAEVKAHG